MSNFSKRLRDLIFEYDSSIASFANNVGICRENITTFLSDKRMPSFENLYKMATYFNCSLNYLIGNQNNFQNLSTNKIPDFGKHLVYLIKKNKTNIHQVGLGIEVSTTLIYSWINSKNKPKVASLIKLANYFDCTLDEIVGIE